MAQTDSASIPASRATTVPGDFYLQMGVLVGVVMPIVSALIYPTYFHQISPIWLEYTRLIELPFVLSELLVIHLCIRAGFRDADVWKVMPTDARVAFVLLCVGLTVSSLFISQHLAASLTLSLINLVHLRFAAAIFFLAKVQSKRNVGKYIPLLGAGLLALAALTAWRFALPPPAATFPGGKIEWSAALPGFISVRHFGAWTGAIAAAFLVVLLFDGRAKDRWTAPLYVVAAAMTIWSGTRAAVLAMLVVAMIVALTLKRLPGLRTLCIAASLTGLAAGVAWVCLPGRDPAFMLFVPADLQSADIATGGRLALWHATFLKWLQGPIFGWGSGSTFWEVYVGWTHTQPHNAVLQFLISWGLVGAAGALWLLGRAVTVVHRPSVTDPVLLPLIAMTYSLLFQSLLEGMLHYPRFVMAIMLGLAVLLANGDRSMRA